jgi:hypothetical protein
MAEKMAWNGSTEVSEERLVVLTWCCLLTVRFKGFANRSTA